MKCLVFINFLNNQERRNTKRLNLVYTKHIIFLFIVIVNNINIYSTYLKNHKVFWKITRIYNIFSLFFFFQHSLTKIFNRSGFWPKGQKYFHLDKYLNHNLTPKYGLKEANVQESFSFLPPIFFYIILNEIIMNQKMNVFIFSLKYISDWLNNVIITQIIINK